MTIPIGDMLDRVRSGLMRKAMRRFSNRPYTVGLWLACVLSAAAQAPPRQARPAPANLPEVNPYTSAADLAIGRAIYNGRCGHCHGLSGEGGRGAVAERRTLPLRRVRSRAVHHDQKRRPGYGDARGQHPRHGGLAHGRLRAATGPAGRVGSRHGRRRGRRGRLCARRLRAVPHDRRPGRFPRAGPDRYRRQARRAPSPPVHRRSRAPTSRSTTDR